jgi:hypothetical protein
MKPKGSLCFARSRVLESEWADQVYYRRAVPATDLFGGFNAVHRSLQADVHQHDIRFQAARHFDGILTPRRSSDTS